MKNNNRFNNLLLVISKGTKFFPVINQPRQAATTFLSVALFFIFLTGCSSTHKTIKSHAETESKIDKTEKISSSTISTTTTEKVDTTVKTKSDSAQISFYTPYNDFLEDDTATITHEIESGSIKITISEKPMIVNGRRKGTQIIAQAIKKTEEIPVTIDRTIISHSATAEQTKTDVIESKSVTDKDRIVEKRKFNFMGLAAIIFIILVLLYMLRNKIKKLL